MFNSRLLQWAEHLAFGNFHSRMAPRQAGGVKSLGGLPAVQVALAYLIHPSNQLASAWTGEERVQRILYDNAVLKVNERF